MRHESVRHEDERVGAAVLVRALIDRLGFGLRTATQPKRRPTPSALFDRLDLSLPADPHVLQHIRRALRHLAHDLELDQDQSEGLLVAVGEAVSNAIEHAYLGSGGTIFLRARREGSMLVIEIEDHGRWRRSGGRRGHGLELMRALTDGVYVNATAAGTTVRLTLWLPMRLLQADHGTLAFLSPDRPASFMRVYTMGKPPEEHGSIFPRAGTPSGRVAETGASFVTDDFAATLPAGLEVARYQQLGPVAIVPVRSEQECIGTIDLGRIKRTGSHPFTHAEVRLLEGIAEIGGTAIHRARLDHKLQQAYVQMVVALAQTIESRDSYTAEHGERMVVLAERTARELGCSEGEVQDIRWGARLHDIGKIGVPDAILSKPGVLTDQEWTTMRQHPILGEEILRSVERMRGVATLVRHHQEKWDGTGYPDGLTGEAIPLGSRILAVVDAYGAITEARPYKPARTVAEAVAEIKRCAGNQFDPRVTEVFCKVVEEFI